MTSAKRVLLLMTEVFGSGGIQRFNRTLLAACSRLGLECEVLSINDTDETVRAGTPPPGIRVRGFGRDKLRFAASVTRALSTSRFECVLVGHINFLALTVSVLLFRPFGRPRAMLIAHGTEVWSGIGRRRRLALRAMKHILCVSDFTKRSMLRQAPELTESRFRVFPNALGDSWVTQQQSLADVTVRNELPARFLLSVARLSRHDRTKGIVTVIETLGLLEDRGLHYVIAGAGDDIGFLRTTAQQFGVTERVHFLGSVSDAELAALYRRAQAFVLPSSQEGFGIVYLEAMFFGAPVIAAREKGVIDVVRDGQTGLLVRYNDARELGAAIERMLADGTLRERLRAQARATVTGDGEFTFASFVRRCEWVLL